MRTGTGGVVGIERHTLPPTLDDRTAAHLARLAREAQSATSAKTPAAPGEDDILLTPSTMSVIKKTPCNEGSACLCSSNDCSLDGCIFLAASSSSQVDVATLAATARALSDDCQPVDFAGWGACTDAAPRRERSNSASSRSQQQSRAQSLPKVPPGHNFWESWLNSLVPKHCKNFVKMLVPKTFLAEILCPTAGSFSI